MRDSITVHNSSKEESPIKMVIRKIFVLDRNTSQQTTFIHHRNFSICYISLAVVENCEVLMRTQTLTLNELFLKYTTGSVANYVSLQMTECKGLSAT